MTGEIFILKLGLGSDVITTKAAQFTMDLLLPQGSGQILSLLSKVFLFAGNHAIMHMSTEHAAAHIVFYLDSCFLKIRP